MANIELAEGAGAFNAFKAAMKGILAVPHSRIAEAVEKHKAGTAKKAVKPGPKPSVKRHSQP